MKEELRSTGDQIRDYEFSEIEDDPRFLIINKEVKFAYIFCLRNDSCRLYSINNICCKEKVPRYGFRLKVR